MYMLPDIGSIQIDVKLMVEIPPSRSKIHHLPMELQNLYGKMCFKINLKSIYQKNVYIQSQFNQFIQ